MKNTYHVLDEVLNSLSNVNGIVMYSIFQLPYDEKRISVLVSYSKNQNLYHLQSKILLSKKADLTKINSLIKLNFLLKHCAKNISCPSN